MVIVRYRSQLGNQIFQYCFARILAQRIGTILLARQIGGFKQTGTKFLGAKALTCFKNVQIQGHNYRMQALASQGSSNHLILDGYFQRAEYFETVLQTLRDDWLFQGSLETTSSFDATIHVRGGNWIGGNEKRVHSYYPMLPVSYFRSILQDHGFRKIAIVTSDKNDPVVVQLQQEFSAKVFSGTAIEDFMTLRRSRNVLLSVSTFSWWAAFLSFADNIFYPNTGLFNTEEMKKRRDLNWRPDLWPAGDKRYVKCSVPGPAIWDGTRAQVEALID